MEPIELKTHDMYGDEIHRIGETGYGVSVSFWCRPQLEEHNLRPEFTIFHISDGFRQSLFSVQVDMDRAQLCNSFPERIFEVMSARPHGDHDTLASA